MPKIKISRVLHAGYIFEDFNTRFIFDPVFKNPFSVNCYAFPFVKFNTEQVKLIRFDAVIISHYHDDHCCFESLNLISKDTPVFIFCVHDEMIELIQKLGFKTVQAIFPGNKIKIGLFEIKIYKALDSDVDSIFHIKYDQLNILNVVDSWIDHGTLNELQLVPKWDLILWPFQVLRELEVLSPTRFQNLNIDIPAELIEQIKILSPKNLVPSSCQFQHEDWSWYNNSLFAISYKKFEQNIKCVIPEINITQLKPGDIFELNEHEFKLSGNLNWVQKGFNSELEDETEVKKEGKTDYQFDPLTNPNSMSFIAAHLELPNTKQIEFIENYITNDLMRRFKEISQDQNSYFFSKKLWQLIVYFSENESKTYTFEISNKFIKLPRQEISSTKVNWLTEICAIKLYSALIKGESLSSLYIRVNERRFSSKIEENLKNFDVLEDPLIQALYFGKFATYQKHQLEKLGLNLSL